MARLFDIDQMVAEFEPVVIKFRGNEYTLGATTLQVVACTELFEGEEEEGAGSGRRVLAHLEAALRTLCPDLEAPLKEQELSSPEEIALLPVVTEVMKRFALMSKSAEGQQGEPDTGDGS